MVTRATVGAGPIYGQRAFAVHATSDLWWLAIAGALAAVVAAGFKWFLALAEERRRAARPARNRGGPHSAGSSWACSPSGFQRWRATATSRSTRSSIASSRSRPSLALLAAKIVATSASVASGVPGGIFTPMLLVGAAFGSLWAQFIDRRVAASAPDAGGYALVGMAATTAASIHAPLTAAVLVFELSGDYAIVLPLILATAVATAVSRAIGGESVYATELRRRGLGWELTLDGRQLDRVDCEPARYFLTTVVESK